MSIENGNFVACSYDLFDGNGQEADLIERAPAESPLKFIQGIGMMLPNFEEKLAGLKEGDTFDFVLSPEEAYGESSEQYIMKLDKTIFTDAEGNFDAEVVREGNTIPMRTQEDQVINGFVNEVGDDFVELDFNPPLAGMTLHFKGTVLEARPATAEDEAYIEALNHQGDGCDCGKEKHSSGGCGGCGGGCC